MKLTVQGSPQEIAAFLGMRSQGMATSEPLRMDFPTLDFAADAAPAEDPDAPKPSPQTIAPGAIERLEFGVDQAGAPIDVAAVHRSIGELLRSPAFQRAAAANLPPLDAFEAPMMHAKRFLYAHCIRDNQFNLGALEAFCARYLAPTVPPTAVSSFAGEAPYTPPPGTISVTFEGEKIPTSRQVEP